MGLFVAYLAMLDPERNQLLRPQHLEYLNDLEKEGKIFAKGPFTDGSGGMVIYIADSMEEAKGMAEADPYVAEKVRNLTLIEWKVSGRIHVPI